MDRPFTEKQYRRQTEQRQKKREAGERTVIVAYHVPPAVNAAAVYPSAEDSSFVENQLHPSMFSHQVDPVEEQAAADDGNAESDGDAENVVDRMNARRRMSAAGDDAVEIEPERLYYCKAEHGSEEPAEQHR